MLTSVHSSDSYFTPRRIFGKWLDPPEQMEKESLWGALQNEDTTSLWDGAYGTGMLFAKFD